MEALSSLATTLLDQDKRQESFDTQMRALGLARSLFADNPNNMDLKRSLIIALTRFGDTTLAVKQDPAKALLVTRKHRVWKATS